MPVPCRTLLAGTLGFALAMPAAAGPRERRSLHASAARLAEEAAPAQPKKPFFRTKKGIVALALLAAGVAWAVHASQSERVPSPLR